MKLVVDANVLISCLVKDSIARKILLSDNFSFYSPAFIKEEATKYKEEVCSKAKLSSDDFDLLLTLLLSNITILKENEYASFLEKAKHMIEDQKDVPYLAVALMLNAEGILTQDKDFQRQQQMRIYTLHDIVRMF